MREKCNLLKMSCQINLNWERTPIPCSTSQTTPMVKKQFITFLSALNSLRSSVWEHRCSPARLGLTMWSQIYTKNIPSYILSGWKQYIFNIKLHFLNFFVDLITLSTEISVTGIGLETMVFTETVQRKTTTKKKHDPSNWIFLCQLTNDFEKVWNKTAISV